MSSMISLGIKNEISFHALRHEPEDGAGCPRAQGRRSHSRTVRPRAAAITGGGGRNGGAVLNGPTEADIPKDVFPEVG